MRTLIIIIVSLTSIGLVAAFNWQLAITTPDISPITDNREINLSLDGEQSVLFKPKGIELYQAKLRPLFSPLRRPWVPPAQEVTPDLELMDVEVQPSEIPRTIATPQLDAKIIGIQKTPDGAMALLADSSGSPPSWIKIGAMYKDWKVEEITNSWVRLINGQSTVKFDLYPEPDAATP